MNEPDDEPQDRLLAAIFGRVDDDEPPPAWLNIRLGAPLGDTRPDDATQDDG